jgi:hypothetical protein
MSLMQFSTFLRKERWQKSALYVSIEYGYAIMHGVHIGVRADDAYAIHDHIGENAQTQHILHEAGLLTAQHLQDSQGGDEHEGFYHDKDRQAFLYIESHNGIGFRCQAFVNEPYGEYHIERAKQSEQPRFASDFHKLFLLNSRSVKHSTPNI